MDKKVIKNKKERSLSITFIIQQYEERMKREQEEKKTTPTPKKRTFSKIKVKDVNANDINLKIKEDKVTKEEWKVIQDEFKKNKLLVKLEDIKKLFKNHNVPSILRGSIWKLKFDCDTIKSFQFKNEPLNEEEEADFLKVINDKNINGTKIGLLKSLLEHYKKEYSLELTGNEVNIFLPLTEIPNLNNNEIYCLFEAIMKNYLPYSQKKENLL